MLRRLGLVSSALILAVIIYATIVPIGWRPQTGHVHFERVAAYFSLGGSLVLGLPKRPLLVALILVLIACGLEYLQTFIPTRDGRLFDAFEKSLGALAGVGIGYALTLWAHRKTLEPL